MKNCGWSITKQITVHITNKKSLRKIIKLDLFFFILQSRKHKKITPALACVHEHINDKNNIMIVPGKI